MSMSLRPHPFLYLKKSKMVLLREKMELDPQSHIYLESVSPGERHKHIYMATPLLVFKKKKPKMVLLPENNGATGQKLWHAETN